MKRTLLLVAGLFPLISQAETVKDREGAVREDRDKMEGNTGWIYNDWRRGFEEAKRSAKPLMVVLRCVPCLACMGIDAEVMAENELKPLIDRFVRVRLINANSIDLSLFQFDYDLSFATMFFNGDGTVHGRYGSWTHQKNSQETDTRSFKEAMKGALALHENYPANKAAIEDKQGRKMPVNDPLQLPQLAGKYRRNLDWEGKVVQSCVHCHQVGDGIRAQFREQNKPIPREWIYPMPMPETIGITLTPESAAAVSAVEAGSAAERAGLKAGDALIVVSNQPVISSADVSWALHHAPATGHLTTTVERAGKREETKIPLVQDWRMHSDISHRVGTWPMRAMAIGGLVLEDLPVNERAKHGIASDGMALWIKHAGEYGEHAAAKNAGFRKDDIVVELGGSKRRVTESFLIGHLLENHAPGEKIKATVLRDGRRIELSLPVQ